MKNNKKNNIKKPTIDMRIKYLKNHFIKNNKGLKYYENTHLKEKIKKCYTYYEFYNDNYNNIEIFFINCCIYANIEYLEKILIIISCKEFNKLTHKLYYFLLIGLMNNENKDVENLIKFINKKSLCKFKKLEYIDFMSISNPIGDHEFGNCVYLKLHDNSLFWKNKEAILIPKTGCCSIAFSIKKTELWHVPVLEYPKFLHKKLKTIVRNPYTRLLSGYYFIMRGGFKNINNPDHKIIISKYDTFKSFVMNFLNKEMVSKFPIKDRSFEPFFCQYIYVCDKDGKLLLDKENIGRFEKFRYEVKRLYDIDNIKCYNYSNNYDHNNIEQYYDKETQDRVYELYRKDFELFNYSYELPS